MITNCCFSVLFFLLGFWVGFEIRKPALAYCLKCHLRMLRRLNTYMLKTTFYKKKAGFAIDAQDPDELNGIIAKYHLNHTNV